ncbi:glycosyltransferase family 4 protein [Plesiomonas shigelloides]|uniref:glycosyltransferase family 4 protein n=1 Tax=Plesiomonas shigelloides TaxID=703 RepID=UPI00387F1A3F
MKALIFTSELKFSGPNNVILSLVKGLSRFNIEVKVCGLRYRKNNDYINRVIEYGGTCETPKKYEPPMLYMIKTLLNFKADFVSSHGIRSDLFLCFFSFFINLNIISTVHNVPDEDYRSRYNPLVSFLMINFHYLVFKRHKIKKVAVSNNVKNKLVLKSAKNIVTIYNGVIPENYDNSSIDKELIENSLRLESGKKRVVFCGHLTQIKQPLIVQEVAIRFPQYDFLILGDGPQKCKLNPNIPNLKILGRVSNVHEYMLASDYFIMPSITEGMPMAFIESMLANLYPICSDIAIFKELSKIEGISMSLFKLNDINTLHNIFKNLDAVNHSINNRRIALKMFSDISMSKQYIKLANNE